MYLNDVPTDPFAQPKTRVQQGIAELEKAVWTGVGMAIGLGIGGFVFYMLSGKREKFYV